MLRTVKAYSTDNPENVVTIEANVSNWGELKPLLVSNGLKVDGMSATIRNTQTTVQSDASVLPDTNGEPLLIFLTPTKTKSGN